ncbi:hypothetical protein IAT38_003102 [Cryptococcus sp. DSM 104549]
MDPESLTLLSRFVQLRRPTSSTPGTTSPATLPNTNGDLRTFRGPNSGTFTLFSTPSYDTTTIIQTNAQVGATARTGSTPSSTTFQILNSFVPSHALEEPRVDDDEPAETARLTSSARFSDVGTTTTVEPRFISGEVVDDLCRREQRGAELKEEEGDTGGWRYKHDVSQGGVLQRLDEASWYTYPIPDDEGLVQTDFGPVNVTWVLGLEKS